MNKKSIARIALFEGKKIRKTWHNDKWWFSVIDVCAALTDSADAGAYWRKSKQRFVEEGSEVVTFCHGLKLEAMDGKKYITDCADTEGMLRIIQSIPSPKAEPFKLWLAKVGYERIQEIEDPELATKRTRELYKAKGYEILTAEISKAAFGITPSEYKKLKGLKRENLRDHMNDLELVFSMLGEAATNEITNTEHPEGFYENKKVSKRGGSVAKEARVRLEKETGKKITSKENYLINKLSRHKKVADK